MENKTNKIKFLLAMLFLTIFLDLIPSLGFIAVGKISITTIHIPTIMSSVVLGPFYGMITGLVFGMLSLFRAFFTEGAVIDYFFQNPFIAIFSRILIGLITGYVFIGFKKLFREKNTTLAIIISSIIGSFSNTIFVLYALYILYADELMKIFNVSSRLELKYFIFKIISTNGMVEAITAMIVVTIFVKGYYKYLDKKENI